jgi:hypothetical protein
MAAAQTGTDIPMPLYPFATKSTRKRLLEIPHTITGPDTENDRAPDVENDRQLDTQADRQLDTQNDSAPDTDTTPATHSCTQNMTQQNYITLTQTPQAMTPLFHNCNLQNATINITIHK